MYLCKFASLCVAAICREYPSSAALLSGSLRRRLPSCSEATLFSCLFLFFTPGDTRNRSNSFSWLACSASDFSVLFLLSQVNYAQNDSRCLQQITPKGRVVESYGQSFLS